MSSDAQQQIVVRRRLVIRIFQRISTCAAKGGLGGFSAFSLLPQRVREFQLRLGSSVCFEKNIESSGILC
jgi:hypothetical protein